VTLFLFLKHRNGSAVLLGGKSPETRRDSGREVRVKKSLAPVQPPAILCIGLNYRCHAEEIGAKPPRHWQKHGGGGQWVRGKSFDTFCPLGPELVTADESLIPKACGYSAF